MIPTINENISTNLDQNVFSIDEERSGLIISLLRNNIYSNTLLAAFKESVSNSLDEHSKYDITKPVDVWLPNYFTNNITIRDYANGISKEFMLNDYTKVGLSTKSNDNTLTGGLGIGRMSPLAYTDLYTVTSITIDSDEAKYKREYVISKENNKVFVSLLLEEDVTNNEDEITGVSVSFEIKKEDFTTLSNYVKEHTKYLTNVNIDGVLVQPPIYNEEFKSFKTHTTSFANANNLVGLIGGLPNYIRLQDLKYTLNREVYGYIESRLINNAIVFNIPIGSIDQAADKNVQLSTRTKNTLCSLITQIVEDYKELVAIKVKDFTCFTDVLTFLDKNNFNTDSINWSGKTVSDRKWLCDIVRYKSTKKGYTCSPYTSTYGEHFYSSKTYYYNDLNYIPTVKELEQCEDVKSDLSKIILVNNIDNNYYNLPCLSNFLPIDRLVKATKVRKTPVKTNKKCYRLSTYDGEIGRELNISKELLSNNYYYISMEFYNKYVNNYLKPLLFNYINKDIYVVNDVSLVKDSWTDLIQFILNDFSVLNSNFILYLNNYRFNYINEIEYKTDFIKEHPNHPITMFLEDAKVFDNKLQHKQLINHFISEGLLELKQGSFNMKDLIQDIDNTYIMIKGSISSYGYNTIQNKSHITHYIELVDFYNKHQNNNNNTEKEQETND
jgi:hypothetical protein